MKVYMKRLLLVYLPIIAAALLAVPASAQRTSDKTFAISISPRVSAYSLPSGGLELSVEQYIFNSYWKAGVCAVDWNQKVHTEEKNEEKDYFNHTHWTVRGGWMYRIAGTYNRIFSLYAGGCAFLGANSFYMFKRLPKELDPNYPSLEFIYGIEPALEMEVFVSKKVALTLGVQSPFTFGSSVKTDIWHLTGSLGIRINI